MSTLFKTFVRSYFVRLKTDMTRTRVSIVVSNYDAKRYAVIDTARDANDLNGASCTRRWEYYESV